MKKGRVSPPQKSLIKLTPEVLPNGDFQISDFHLSCYCALQTSRSCCLQEQKQCALGRLHSHLTREHHPSPKPLSRTINKQLGKSPIVCYFWAAIFLIPPPCLIKMDEGFCWLVIWQVPLCRIPSHFSLMMLCSSDLQKALPWPSVKTQPSTSRALKWKSHVLETNFTEDKKLQGTQGGKIGERPSPSPLPLILKPTCDIQIFFDLQGFCALIDTGNA